MRFSLSSCDETYFWPLTLSWLHYDWNHKGGLYKVNRLSASARRWGGSGDTSSVSSPSVASWFTAAIRCQNLVTNQFAMKRRLTISSGDSQRGNSHLRVEDAEKTGDDELKSCYNGADVHFPQLAICCVPDVHSDKTKGSHVCCFYPPVWYLSTLIVIHTASRTITKYLWGMTIKEEIKACSHSAAPAPQPKQQMNYFH